MPYNRNQARPLLTDREYDLFTASLSDRIGSLRPAELRAKIDRSRAVADKYRDLYRRQSRATRERTGTGRGMSGAANERTHRKAQIFSEALDRFQARLATLEAKKDAAGTPKTPRPRASARASSKKIATRAARRTARRETSSE